MNTLDFFNSIPKYAIAVPNPKFDYVYTIKYRMDKVLARKVWTLFKTKYPTQILTWYVTKKDKVLLGGEYNKQIVDIISLSNIINQAKRD